MKPRQSPSKGVRPNPISDIMVNYNVSTSPDLYIEFSTVLFGTFYLSAIQGSAKPIASIHHTVPYP